MRDKEICDFNVALLAGVIACCRHLVVDTNRTYFESARQVFQFIHVTIVTANTTCVLLAAEDMTTQRINTHIAGTQGAALSVSKHLGNRRLETPAEKSLPNDRRETCRSPLC